MLKRILESVCLGDSAGAPYEFYAGRQVYDLTTFDFQPRHVFYFNRRFPQKSMKIAPPGFLTDDSEMTMCAFYACIFLIQNCETFAREMLIEMTDDHVDLLRDELLFQYQWWASTSPPFMGRNTRKLFTLNSKKLDSIQNPLESSSQRVKCKKYLRNRYETLREKRFPTRKEEEYALSNGSLMRCTGLLPLLLFNSSFSQIEKVVEADAFLSNPNRTTVQFTTIYLKCILTLSGLLHSSITQQEYIPPQEYFDVIKNVVGEYTEYLVSVSSADSEDSDESILEKEVGLWCSRVFDLNFTLVQDPKKKGYIAYAFFYALRAYMSSVSSITFKETTVPSGRDCLKWVIQQGGDTDTNGAIAGGLLGSFLDMSDIFYPLASSLGSSNLSGDVSDAYDVIDVKDIPLETFMEVEYRHTTHGECFSYRTERPEIYSFDRFLYNIKKMDNCFSASHQTKCSE